MDKEFHYNLKSPISVSVSGDVVEASDVVVKAPRPRDSMNALVFENYLRKAIMEVSSSGIGKSESDSKSDEAEDNSIDAKIEMFETVIMSFTDAKMLMGIVGVLKDLICEGNQQSPQATIGGVKFTKPLFDELSHVDLKSLLARYSYHFLLQDLI